MKVITNHQPRELHTWEDLSEQEREEFNYLDADERLFPRLVKYRGEWYDAMEAEGISMNDLTGYRVYPTHPLAAWDAISFDTVSSGIVFRLLTREEEFRWGVGRYDYIFVGRYVA